MTDETVKEIGSRDTTYDLISVLYHALQGAETYIMYLDDAEDSGDQEVTQFFRQIIDEEKRRADRAKQLLSTRLNK